MDEQELRNRISQADSAKEFPTLNEGVVAAAALGKAKATPSFKVARWSLGGAIAAVLAVGVALPQFQQPQPLFELAGGGNSSATVPWSSSTAESADAPMAEDASMIWPGWVEYTYIADGLSNEGGSGEIFEVRKVGDPMDLVAKIAQKFGVSGKPAKDEWSSDEYPSYSITGDDYSVNVWWYGTGGWNFNRWSNQWGGCAEPGIARDSEGAAELERSADASDCAMEEFAPTPELVPSEQQMLEVARDTFGSLGMSLDYSQARTWRDDWGGLISIPLMHDGETIPLEANMGWDSRGEISYASGVSVEIISRGSFDTISPAAAVDRLADWRWFGGAPSRYYEELYADTGSIARSEAAVSSPAIEPEDAGGGMDSSEGQASDAVVDDVKSEDPIEYIEPTEPEIIDIRVTRAEVATLSLYDSAGNMWLVPGYLLYNDQGWFDAIVSVVEGVIALPEPQEIMPMVDEPAIEPEIDPAG